MSPHAYFGVDARTPSAYVNLFPLIYLGAYFFTEEIRTYPDLDLDLEPDQDSDPDQIMSRTKN